METQNSNIIIDGYGLIYRAYFAFINNPLINAKGQNISSLYGFTRILLRIIKDHKPASLVIALDTAKPTFRHAMYTEYKAHREKMPDDLISQIPLLKELLEIAAIPMCEAPGMEADDIMGSLSKKWQNQKKITLLVTGDKDAFQLVEKNTRIMCPQRGISDFILYDQETVFEKLGVNPSQITDYLALVGDTSDNIPGVKGIGPKGAINLLQKFDNLEQIYQNISNVTPKGIQEKLTANRENAFMSQELARIRTDLTLPLEPLSLDLSQIYSEKVAQFLEKLGIPSIAKEIRNEIMGPDSDGLLFPREEIPKATEKRNYKLIAELSDLNELWQKISTHKGMIALDTETTAKSPVEAGILGISISFKEGEAYYIHIQRGKNGLGLVWALIAKDLNIFLKNPDLQFVGQNYKYDYIILKRHGLDPPEPFLDTMVASYLLSPGERRHNLESLSQTYLNESMITFADLTGKGQKKISMIEVPVEKLAEYSAEDADMTLRLAKIMEPKLKEENLWELFEKIERPLITILADMEMEGVAIDPAYFKKLSIAMKKEIITHEREIHQQAGFSFNINSTVELQKILFDSLNLPRIKKTKTGYSTDVSVLEALKGRHPIIESLLQYRMFTKLQNTYVETLPLLINKNTGRIHSSFNQTVAATGRLSSSEPNLQNIPIREDTGRAIRQGFIARKDTRLLSADYSQIELRVMAHLSEDGALIQAFQDDLDIHTITAAQIFQLNESEVKTEHRRIGKIVNFGIIYGQTPFGLSKQLEIPQSEAKKYIENYFKTYPGVKKYMVKVIEAGRQKGWVETYYGRKRHVLGLDDRNRIRREAAERIAVNTPVQGTAADIIKMAMIAMRAMLRKNNFSSKMILQVHDELLFEVPEKEEEAMKSLVRETMENIDNFLVPLKVDIHLGANWDEAH